MKENTAIGMEELQEIQENSFDTWFDRWLRDFKLETHLKESAMKGYATYGIDCIVGDDYTRRRLQDERFVCLLKNKLPGLKIEREVKTLKQKNILGFEIRRDINRVLISWK